MDPKIDQPGSGATVLDFSHLCEGDMEPSTQKRIDTLIDSDVAYIVYLDDEGWLWWSLIPNFLATWPSDSPSDYAEIANAIADLESRSIQPLSADQRFLFGRLVGEAMARLLGDHDKAAALASIEQGRRYLEKKGVENANRWYLEVSLAAGGLALAGLFVAWLMRDRAVRLMGLSAFHSALGFAFGLLGSVIFVSARLNKITMNAELGPRVHRMESAARLVVGGFGGLLAALLVQSGQLRVLSDVVSGSIAGLLLVCFASGYSERIMPSIIKRAEKSITGPDGDAGS
jgi:hypothetical protein